MALYKGFSTYNRNKKFRAVDFDLVKQDLLNHFNIKKGEKLMNPEYGTMIWSAIFEPMTEAIKSEIVSDIKRIVSSDPRIAVNNVIITEYEHGLQIEIALTYIAQNNTQVLYAQFDRDARKARLL